MSSKFAISKTDIASNIQKIVFWAAISGLVSACGGGAPDVNGSDSKAPIDSSTTVSEVVDSVVVGGEVVGYAGGDLVVKDRQGGDIKIGQNGRFILPTQRKRGDPYEVSIVQQPVAQICQLLNGQGTATKDILDLQISCETDAFYKSTPNFVLPKSGLTESFQLAIYALDTNCENTVSKLNEVNGGSAVYIQNVPSDPTKTSCDVQALTQGTKFNWKIAIKGADGNNVTFNEKATNPNGTVPISADDVIKQVETQVNAVLNDPTLNPSVASWYILPESLRPWRTGTGWRGVWDEMAFLANITKRIRELDHEKNRPITGYQPYFRVASDLVQFIGYFDLFINGMVRPTWTDTARAQKIYDSVKLKNTMASENATKYFPISSIDIVDNTSTTLSEDVLKKTLTKDVYLTAAAGAKGLWVSYWSKVTPEERSRLTSLYSDIFKTINVSEPDLGRAWVKGEMGRADNLIPTVTAGNTTDLYVQNYHYGGKRYVVAVNGSTTATIEGTLKGWPTGSVIRELNPQTETQFRSLNSPSQLPFAIEANGVRVWRVSID